MEMKNGMIRSLMTLAFLLLPLALFAQGQIYKVVDKDGNITFTDQRPNAEAQPMDLPPLSVIQTDIQTPAVQGQDAAAAGEEAQPPTSRDLRKQFSDFRISRPLAEETFWGTENTVVVTWESSQPIPPELQVTLFVDGKAQQGQGSGSLSLVLDRGEHQVYAELRDERKRRIITTPVVTFFVQQQSVNRRRPGG
jgi:hypothetical protein